MKETSMHRSARFETLLGVMAVSLGLGAVGVATQERTNEPPVANVTFAKDIAPILYRSCVSCHRPGEVAPMSLITYRDVRPWASAIRRRVTNREMPPWTADPQYGHFRRDPRLNDEEIKTIARWVDAGAREGDAAALPPLPAFEEGWQIGKPDVVFEMPAAFDIPSQGEIPYQYFEVPTNFKQDMWVQAAEARYGDPAHVHHIIVSVVPPADRIRKARSILQIKPIQQPGEVIAQRTPRNKQDRGLIEQDAAAERRAGATPLVNKALGEEPPRFAEGTGRLVPAGSTILFQMHYQTNGTPGKDRSRVGLIFSKTPPTHEVYQTAVINNQFALPPGAENYLVEAEGTFTEDVKVWSVHGHMHYRGKDMTYVVTYPDGRSETVFRIPKWDLNWQQEFWLEQPIVLPKGSKLRVTSHFDNSTGNRLNPDPKATVTWGDQTWQEMMGGFIQYTVEETTPGRPTARSGAH
jgi:hypothetical protein